MKTRKDQLRERLSKLLTNGQAILVFGSGITIQATGQARTASWAGLLDSGIEHCLGYANFCEAVAQQWAEDRRDELRNRDPKSYVKIAGEIEKALTGLKYERQEWLKNAIGGLIVRDPGILNSIKKLAVRFNPMILTTNYDTLLSNVLGVEDVTWDEVDAVMEILRGKSPNVLHIHGLWSKADSVVLGTDSYDELLQNSTAQTLQKACTALNSLVFIGCGDGVDDDNIGALLKWFATALPDNSHRHYILLREEDVEKYPSTRWLVPISYGRSYDELLGFLDSLMPIMDQKAMERQLASAKELIGRLADEWTRRNNAFQDETDMPSKSVAGYWKGQQIQQSGPDDEPIAYPVALELDIKEVTVTGTFAFKFGPEGRPLVDESLQLEGELEHGRYLRLTYKGDENRLQFGTLFLEISTDGDTLVGNDIGYGYTTRQTLTAMTRLRRSAQL